MKSMLLQRIRLLYVSGFVVSAVFMASCSDDDTDKNAVYDPNKPVVLESYSPQEGGVGTKLIIRGENFGYDPSKVKVRIANDENREARVVSAKGNRIYAIVPARADTGKVTVTIGEGEEAQEVAFEEEFQYEFKKNLSTSAAAVSTPKTKTAHSRRRNSPARCVWLWTTKIRSCTSSKPMPTNVSAR